MMSFWIKAHFLDASAAVKLVATEVGSDVIKPYFDANVNFYMTSLCFAETLGVLKVKHFYRNQLTEPQYFASAYMLTAYARENRIQLVETPLRERFFDAKQIAEACKLDLSDAMQILTVRDGPQRARVDESKSILVTADDLLAEAARKHGLRVWNVLQQPQPPSA